MNTRGGLRQNGPRMLWRKWQRAHLRADVRESAEQKYMRRGNDAADHLANEGRKLHDSVTRLRTRPDFLHEVAKSWAEWTGRAAELQFSSEFQGCDHDRTDGRRACPQRRVGRKAKVKESPPVVARLLRRLSCAAAPVGENEETPDTTYPSVEA